MSEKEVEEGGLATTFNAPQSMDGKTVANGKLPSQWDPDDPDNAVNWSLGKRMYHTISIALLCLATTFGASVFTGSQPLAHEFGVSEVAALLGLSLYTLAQGFGPALGAPVSETYGRLIVYRVSMPVSMLFTLGAGFSQNLTQFLVCRFLAGLTGSPVIAVGGGSLADLWKIEDRATSIGLFLMAPFAGPALGPFIGGFSTMSLGWRWTQWDILFLSLPLYVFSLGMQETYYKVIASRKAQKNGVDVSELSSDMSGWGKAKMFFVTTLARPVHMMLTEPIVSSFCLYVALIFAILFGFIVAFPIVYGEIYGFNLGESGLPFLSIGIGVLLGGITVYLCDVNLYQKQRARAMKQGKSSLPPERRLYAAMIGSIGLPIGLFWFAWSARPSVHWIVPTLAAMPFAWSNMCISVSSILYTVDCYGPLLSASALSANSIARYSAAAGFPLFAGAMYHKLGVQWATSLFGFLSLLMLPIPWILFRWGPQVRARSSYDITKFDT